MIFLKLKSHEVILHFLFYCILLLLSILPMGAFRFGDISVVFPAIEIIIIFFFSVYKPDILPLWLLFVYGIILDLIYGLPVGISIIPLITLSYLVRNQRQIFFRKDFTIVFLGFAIACLLYLGVKYFIFSWYFSYFINFSLVIIQGIATIFLYPITHYFLQRIEKIIH
jgi:rod shape-determining protein MreD